jgi:hypothetical protein
VEVGYRQQIGLALDEPVLGRGPLALGTVPVATAVVGDLVVIAVHADRDMAAESRGSATLDGRHHLELAEADMTGMGFAPGSAMIAEDVGDLQR